MGFFDVYGDLISELIKEEIRISIDIGHILVTIRF